MEKLGNTGKVIITIVIVGILIIVAVIYSGGQNGSVATNNDTDSGSATLNATSPTQTAMQTNTSATDQAVAEKTSVQKIPTSPTQAAPSIHLITPVANDIWQIGTQNTISWDKAPNITGSISLIDASTKQSAGVILPEVGPNQTSYSWNTRDVLLDRTNPLKKNVVPGTYMIVVSFDGNNLQPITSPVFTITN